MVKRHLELIAPSASPEEAAAIVAALERFLRATAAPAGTSAGPAGPDPWQRAALLEGVARTQHGADLTDPWINT